MDRNNMPPYWYRASESPFAPYNYNASWPIFGNISQTPQALSEVNNGPVRVPEPASQSSQNAASGVYGTSIPSWPPWAFGQPYATTIVPRSASDHYQAVASGLQGVSRGAMIAADALLELSQIRERPTVRDHRDFAPEAPGISGNVDIVRNPRPPMGIRVETQQPMETAGKSQSSDGASSSTLQGAPKAGVKRNAPDGEETAPSQPAKRTRRQLPAKKPAADKVQEHEAASAPLPQPKKTAKAQGKGTKRKLETSASDQSKEQEEAAIAPANGPLTAQDETAAENADDNSSATATAPPAKKKAKTKRAPIPTYTCEISQRKYNLIKNKDDITTPNWYARRNAYQYPTPPFSRVPSFDSQLSENDPAVTATPAESRDPARITRTLALLDNAYERSFKDSVAARKKIVNQNFLLSRRPEIDEVDRLDDPAFVRWREFEKLREAPAPASPAASASASAPAPEGKPEGEPEEEEETKRCDPKEFAALWNVPYKYDLPVLMEHELEHKDAYIKLRDEDEAKKRAQAERMEQEAERQREEEERKKQEGEKRKEEEEQIEKGEFRRERKKSRRQLEMEADDGAKKN